MKKTILTIKERLGIGGLLNKKYQQKGLSLEMLTLSQKIMEKLMVDKDEGKKINLKNENGRLSWDLKKDKGKEIEFSEDHVKFLKEIIQGFSDAKDFSLEDGFVIDLITKLTE